MTEQEKLLCMMIKRFLDENPDKDIVGTMHIVDGHWEHEVWIQKKNIKTK